MHPVWRRINVVALRRGDVLAELVEDFVRARGVFASGGADLDQDPPAIGAVLQGLFGLGRQRFELLEYLAGHGNGIPQGHKGWKGINWGSDQAVIGAGLPLQREYFGPRSTLGKALMRNPGNGC